MADTYLPAFKSCVKEGQATCVMCSYNAVNGIPSCANGKLLTGKIREEWGFRGYIVSDCGAVNDLMVNHHFTNTTSETCRVAYDAGIDVACESFLQTHLHAALADGNVTNSMMETALGRGFGVLMRLGYFEKDEVRPYKHLGPSIVDSEGHRALALEAARQSIVLLKNERNLKTGLPLLPLKSKLFQSRQAGLALIGPHFNASQVFLGNYHGLPSFIKTPLGEIEKRVGGLKYELGCEVSSFGVDRLQEAEDLAASSSQVVLFVGISGETVEYETNDRVNLSLPGLQDELIRRVSSAAQQPVILFLISGGPVDCEEWKSDPNIGAIFYAGYIGQSGGEAMADVLFGAYNPSGRLAHTFYANSYLDQVPKGNMNLRPSVGYPGRTYRFYTGSPVYEFGYGLSYTTFSYSWNSEIDQTGAQIISTTDTSECYAQVGLLVRNTGVSTGDHSVLAFLAPPNAGRMGRPIKNLVAFERLSDVGPNVTGNMEICIRRNQFELANKEGEFELISGEWRLMIGNIERTITVPQKQSQIKITTMLIFDFFLDWLRGEKTFYSILTNEVGK